MKLFGDEVNHTSTNSPLNILQVENFSEIFFGVFEVELNGQRYPVEKVSEYKGNPVVHIPIRIESVDVLYPFILCKGKSEVIFSEKNLGLPSEDSIIDATPEVLEQYSLAKLTPPIVEQDSSEEISIIDESVKELIYDIVSENTSREDIEKHINEAKEAAKNAVKLYKLKQLKEISDKHDRYNQELSKTLEEARDSLVSEFVSISNKIKDEIVNESTDNFSILREKLDTRVFDISNELRNSLDENFEKSSVIFDKKIREIIIEAYNAKVLPKVEKELNEIALQIVEKVDGIENELYSKLENKADLVKLESFASEIDTIKKSNIELNDTFTKGLNKALSRVGNVNALVEKMGDDLDNRISASISNMETVLEQFKTEAPEILLEAKNKKLSEFDKLKKDYDTIIHNKFEKYKVELRKYAISYGGGGGTVAQQFADGGIINGNIVINGSIQANNYIGLSGGSDVSGLSANWQNTYNTVKSLSSGWGSGGGGVSNVSGLSANWETASSKVRASSANWDNVYNTVTNLSSGWGGSDVSGLSSRWEIAYTSLSTKANQTQFALLSSQTTSDLSNLSSSKANIVGGNNFIGNQNIAGTLSASGSQHWGLTRKFWLLPDWAGIGELPAGTLFGSNGASSGSFSFFPSINGGTVGDKVIMGYASSGGTNVYSAVEIGNVASGFGDLVLMKSGGAVLIGTDVDNETHKLQLSGSASISSDVEITDFTKGVVLRSANGTRFRITITDSGALSSTAL
jgi:hypothetical protein